MSWIRLYNEHISLHKQKKNQNTGNERVELDHDIAQVSAIYSPDYI